MPRPIAPQPTTAARPPARTACSNWDSLDMKALAPGRPMICRHASDTGKRAWRGARAPAKARIALATAYTAHPYATIALAAGLEEEIFDAPNHIDHRDRCKPRPRGLQRVRAGQAEGRFHAAVHRDLRSARHCDRKRISPVRAGVRRQTRRPPDRILQGGRRVGSVES